ncbi:MAG: DinB family protein [Flavobacteriales bacterium]|nr:DinB family protein [Flavobacteriales bacterium]
MSLAIRPAAEDLPAFYHGYVAKADGTDIPDAMRLASDGLHSVLCNFPTDREEYSYAAGKWTVKDVVQHIIDAERIFAYRALRFARNDSSALAGFEENDYVPEALTGRRTLKDLLEEHDLVRSSSIALFRSFPLEALNRAGIANSRSITVRAIGWVIAGHANHHSRIIAERYMVGS